MQYLHNIPGPTHFKRWLHISNVHPWFYILDIVSVYMTSAYGDMDVIYFDHMTDLIGLCANTDVQLDCDEITLLYLPDTSMSRRWNIVKGVQCIYEAVKI